MGVDDGQGGLAFCSPSGRKELDMSEQINCTELMLGKFQGRRRRERQRMSWLDGIIDSMDMNLRKFQGSEAKIKFVCTSVL